MAGTGEEVHAGGCLCGAVRYELRGPLRDVIGCHCEQCRRTSGNYVTATTCPSSALTLHDPDGALRWHRSSEIAERGFCGTCGSNLFCKPSREDRISVMAGTLDAPTGLRLSRHIYTRFKGDYYEIADGLPQHPVD